MIGVLALFAGKPAKGHCVFKLCASGVVIYFRTKSQSICETWIRAIVSVVAAQASASSLARLQPFDGGLSTLTRSASMNAAITKLNMRASSGHPALVRRGSMFKADNPLKAVVDSGRPSLKTHGMLHLTIVCATDLIGKDRSGTSDPYCRINYDGYVVETGVQAATLNPAWNQTFDLPFHRSIT